MATVQSGACEWDDAKNSFNIAKHGVDFQDAIRIFDGIVYEYDEIDYSQGEARQLVTGLWHERIISVVYTWRGDWRRIISARKATGNERRRYIEEFTSVTHGL